MNVDKIRKLLTLNEGRKNKMYKDSKGIPTIGIGHNLRDVPISDRAIDVIFEDDLNDHASELFRSYPWAAEMDEVRQGALIDLFFNMGGPTLAQFKNTLAAMRVGNWEATALGLEQSAWFGQVGNRGPRIVKMFRDGKWPV
jgi:lysozyme